MSFWSIGGGADATILTNGLPSGVDNDLGTVRAGGNISDTDKFKADAVSLGYSRVVTVVSGVNGVTGAMAGGTFNGGDQVIRRVTNDIAGVSNNTLVSGGSNAGNLSDSIHQSKVLHAHYYGTAVRNNQWHETSGIFSPAITVANSGGWDLSEGSDQAANLVTNYTDEAANPSGGKPGELVYQAGKGGGVPVQDDYKEKTVY